MTGITRQSQPESTASVPLVMLNRALLVAALVILGFQLAVYVVYAANLIQFPFDYDQGEGFELVDTIMFSQGRWPYLDTEVYPFYSSNYPPLFHIIAAPFVWFFGPAYWYGRLLGFLGTLVTAAAITYAVYRDGQHRIIALLSGLAFLASNTVYHIGPLFRQHMTMVMFETLAVIILAHANEITHTRQRRRAIIIGLAFILAAGYTKQLAYATAVAALAFLFIRSPRRGIISALAFAGVGAAIFTAINIATNGQWWIQAVSANVNDFYPDQTVALFRLWFGLHGFLLIPALLYAAYELYFDRLSVYSLWLVAATANSILAGKWGAGDSYFASAIAALCILSGLFAARALNRNWRFPDNYLSRLLIQPLRRFAPALTTLSLIIIPVLYIGYGRATLQMPTDAPLFSSLAHILNITPNAHNSFYDSARQMDGQFAGGYADIGHLTTQADIDAGYYIVDLIRAVDQPVLSEEAAFNLLAGKDVITNPTQLLNLFNNGLFEGDDLLAMIENQEFGLIILRAQFYPLPILEAIGQAYRHAETVRMNGFDYIIMRPS
jgi:4-amino-4-deoxy-L-arabinose transferase-like glycosyltransferase